MNRNQLIKIRYILILTIFIMTGIVLFAWYFSFKLPALLTALGTVVLWIFALIIVLFSIIIEFTSNDD